MERATVRSNLSKNDFRVERKSARYEFLPIGGTVNKKFNLRVTNWKKIADLSTSKNVKMPFFLRLVRETTLNPDPIRHTRHPATAFLFAQLKNTLDWRTLFEPVDEIKAKSRSERNTKTRRSDTVTPAGNDGGA